jgi:hypothetical protein
MADLCGHADATANMVLRPLQHVGDVVLPENVVGGAALPPWQEGLLRYAYLLSFHYGSFLFPWSVIISWACFHSICDEVDG